MRTEDEAASLKRLAAQMADELNTKELGVLNDVADVADYSVSAVPSVVGKKYGALFPKIRAVLAKTDAYEAAQRLQAGEPIELQVEGETVTLLPEEVEIRLTPRTGYAVAQEGGYVAAVSTELTPALVKEGLARELVRRIQTMRKDADFRIQDTIIVYYQAGAALAEVMQSFADYIRQETLATELRSGAAPTGAFAQDAALDGEDLKLALVRNA
jgi:isoleucyl-tRNA synthetase